MGVCGEDCVKEAKEPVTPEAEPECLPISFPAGSILSNVLNGTGLSGEDVTWDAENQQYVIADRYITANTNDYTWYWFRNNTEHNKIYYISMNSGVLLNLMSDRGIPLPSTGVWRGFCFTLVSYGDPFTYLLMVSENGYLLKVSGWYSLDTNADRTTTADGIQLNDLIAAAPASFRETNELYAKQESERQVAYMKRFAPAEGEETGEDVDPGNVPDL